MAQNSIGTKRLFGKFLLLLLPVFAVATAAGLLLVAQFFMRDGQDQLNARVGNIVARVSSIIANEPGREGGMPVDSYLGLLMADQAIMCAELFDRDGKVVAAAPQRIGCRGQDAYEPMSLRMPGTASGDLRIRYSSDELATVRQDKRLFTQLALVVGLLVAAFANWLCFRLFVGRPVGALLAAIRGSSHGAAPTAITKPPADELGTVIEAFNAMQIKLREEADRNLAALIRLDHLYNETPTLMFSIDPAGSILSVSGHWLEQTGYAREEVIGEALARFVRNYEDTESWDAAQLTGSGGRDVPLLLARKDGSSMDVLLSAVPGHSDAGSVPDYLCVMSDVSGLNAARRKLQIQAVTDHLTGLPNRQALFEYFARIRKLPNEDSEVTAVLFIDLDNFKWINDTHGHDAGDALLRATAARIRDCIGGSDFLARLGGDEFAIVLRNLRGEGDAELVARRIVAQMNLPFEIGSASAFVGCSAGIATTLEGGPSSEELLRLADLAMYKSKQDGRNRITPYSDDLGVKAGERDNVIAQIRDALAYRHFRLFYQPIVDLKAMKHAGAEALLRIKSPNGGLASPAEIIRVAEETGLMTKIGEWVVNEGLATSQRWAAAGSRLYLSINLSPRQLDPVFMADLVARLRRKPQVASNLMIEITETALMKNAELIVRFFAEVQETGARIALDDFGTGYSSLNYINRFPVDVVKIDRSFVRNLDKTDTLAASRNRALVKASAALCRELKIKVVAEGIETAGELEAVRSMGIEYGQGYHFSPPLPESAFEEWAAAFAGTTGSPSIAAQTPIHDPLQSIAANAR